jgi:hypothetical protein
VKRRSSQAAAAEQWRGAIFLTAQLLDHSHRLVVLFASHGLIAKKNRGPRREIGRDIVAAAIAADRRLITNKNLYT